MSRYMKSFTPYVYMFFGLVLTYTALTDTILLFLRPSYRWWVLVAGVLFFLGGLYLASRRVSLRLSVREGSIMFIVVVLSLYPPHWKESVGYTLGRETHGRTNKVASQGVHPVASASLVQGENEEKTVAPIVPAVKEVVGTSSNMPISPPAVQTGEEETPMEISITKEAPKDENLGAMREGIDREHKTIVLKGDSYYPTLIELATHVTQYEGWRLIIQGYVNYKDPFISRGEFMLGRDVMACCAADIAPMGVLVVNDRSGRFEEGTWWTMEGVIEIKEMRRLKLPRIQIIQAREAEALPGFIYP